MKIISLLFFFLLCNDLLSQVFYNKESNNLRFAGAMNQEVLNLLNEDEKNILNDCILECGVKPDEVVWVTREVYDKLDNPDYYSTKMVFKSSSNSEGYVNIYEGQNMLDKPQFMIFLDRSNGEFEVILQMYY
jgi:hypothetical protein